MNIYSYKETGDRLRSPFTETTGDRLRLPFTETARSRRFLALHFQHAAGFMAMKELKALLTWGKFKQRLLPSAGRQTKKKSMPESPHRLIYPSSTQRTDCQVRRACHTTAHMTTPESQLKNTWLDFDTGNKVLTDQCQKTYGTKTELYSCSRHITHKSGIVRSLLVPSDPFSAVPLKPATIWEGTRRIWITHQHIWGTMNKGREPSVQQVTSFLLPSLFSSCSSKNPAWTTVLTT